MSSHSSGHHIAVGHSGSSLVRTISKKTARRSILSRRGGRRSRGCSIGCGRSCGGARRSILSCPCGDRCSCCRAVGSDNGGGHGVSFSNLSSSFVRTISKNSACRPILCCCSLSFGLTARGSAGFLARSFSAGRFRTISVSSPSRDNSASGTASISYNSCRHGIAFCCDSGGFCSTIRKSSGSSTILRLSANSALATRALA